MFDKCDGLSNLWNGHHIKYRNNNEYSQTVIHQDNSKARFSMFYDHFKWMSTWMRLLWKAIQFTRQTRTLKQRAARLFEESDDEQCGRVKAVLSVGTVQVGIIITFSVVKDAKEKFLVKNSIQRYMNVVIEKPLTEPFFVRHIFLWQLSGDTSRSDNRCLRNGDENIVTSR